MIWVFVYLALSGYMSTVLSLYSDLYVNLEPTPPYPLHVAAVKAAVLMLIWPLAAIKALYNAAN